MTLLEVGTEAPDFEIQNINGPPVTLADFRGRRGVVLLFAPETADPGQINALKALYQRHEEKVGFLILVQKVPSLAVAKVFLKQMGVTLPVLLDEAGEAYRLYGVDKPTVTYYINREGTIVHVDGPKGDLGDAVKALEERLETYLVGGGFS